MARNNKLISRGVTIHDVAEEAGVSISLVSFVLNAKRGPNGEYICSASKATAEKIVAVAERLGYHCNRAASSLRSGHTSTIGMIVADISNSCFCEICRKVENISSEAGYLTVMGSSDDKSEKFGQLINKFLYFGVDGLIVAACSGCEDSIRKALAMDIPVVLIDRDIRSMEDVGKVMLDNELAGRTAVGMLIRRGYRKIALIRYETTINTLLDREKGYVEEMRNNGLNDYIRTGIVAKESMARDIKSVIHQIHETGYEAVIFPSNTITVSGVTAINELGYSIPDDIAVVGFDQGDSSGIFNTNMLFVEQPTKLIAEYSFRMLHAAISNKGKLETKIVDPLYSAL